MIFVDVPVVVPLDILFIIYNWNLWVSDYIINRLFWAPMGIWSLSEDLELDPTKVVPSVHNETQTSTRGIPGSVSCLEEIIMWPVLHVTKEEVRFKGKVQQFTELQWSSMGRHPRFYTPLRRSGLFNVKPKPNTANLAEHKYINFTSCYRWGLTDPFSEPMRINIFNVDKVNRHSGHQTQVDYDQSELWLDATVVILGKKNRHLQ